MPESPKLGKAEYSFYITSRAFDALHQFLGVVLYLGIAFFCYLSIKELAGKTTVANFLLAYITASHESRGWAWIIAKALPWILSVLFFVWATIERYLRKRTVEALQGRIKELELRLDPRRTSSMLTTQGETNPKDQNI